MNDSPPNTPETPSRLVRINARAVADERGVLASPASLLLGVSSAPQTADPLAGVPLAREIHLLAIGSPDQLPEHTPDQVINRPTSVIIPPLVNAHAHLDLTHMGPRPHDPSDGFVAWVDQIRAQRCTHDAHIRASVLDGARMLLMGGTAAVGDIAGAPAGVPSLVPWRALQDTPLSGVSYLEFFGIGASETPARDRLDALLTKHAPELARSSSVRFGLQPHAPNTVAIALYLWAAQRARELGLPLSTHLSETPEEIQFIASGTGPQRELLERLGVWTDDIDVGHAKHPIEHLRPFLQDAAALDPPLLAAHVNALGGHAPALARTSTSVAYCPRASAYFAAERHFGPHPYRELLDAGVNVCLGTDSIVNLPPETCAGPAARICILDEMRFLHQRDATPPELLLAMGTTHGARALGLEPGAYRLDPGARIAGLLAVECSDEHPLDAALRNDTPPEFLLLRNPAC